MRLDCKKICQNSGGNVSSSSMIILQTFVRYAPIKFLPSDVGVDDALEVRESFISISGGRQSAEGADDVEEHLGNVLLVRALRESTSVH